MTDDLVPAGIAESHRLLDDAERQVYAALALGRRLLAEPHPSRPIYQLQLHPLDEGIGLRIWASDGTAGMEAWALLLGVPLDGEPKNDDPTRVHYALFGELDGVRLRVWEIATIPITRAVIVENSSGVRIEYVQEGARRSVPQTDKAAARAWVERNVRQTVPAC